MGNILTALCRPATHSTVAPTSSRLLGAVWKSALRDGWATGFTLTRFPVNNEIS